MPANNTKGIVHYFAGAYPGKIGLLYSPNGWSNPPYYMPYALDNGAFTGFDEINYKTMLNKSSLQRHKPLWVLVPDVVCDADATFKNWLMWKDYCQKYGKLAFAVQDGMEPSDIPKDTFCCFIGGSTEWKLKNAHRFKGVSDWLHIGRVNTASRLKWAEDIGADSVDGTGWFRGDKNQLRQFIEFFEGKKQIELC